MTAVAPRIEHNQKLFEAYVKERGIVGRFLRVVDQLERVALDEAKLHRFAYNPSIARISDDCLLLAYRYHPNPGLSTKICLARMSLTGQVLSQTPLDIPGLSLEDPRFFLRAGQLWLAWVESQWPAALKSVVKIGRCVDFSRIDQIEQPEIPGNDWQGVMKNMVFFESEGQFFCLHSPKVYGRTKAGWEVFGDMSIAQWPWGETRGGCVLPYQPGKLLRFFHSGADTEPGYNRRRYCLGSMVLDAKNPWTVEAIGQRPIVYGSEADELTPTERAQCQQYKKNVVFPCGALEMDGHWLVSVGVNDSACAILKVLPEQLQLP